jgi:hypothetical protein
MTGIIIGNGTAASAEATVTTDGNLKVTLPTADAQTGKVRIVSEVDPGGSSRAATIIAPESTEDYRLRVGIDCVEDCEVFSYANQQTSKHTYTITTMTMDLSGGFLRTNASGITTINTGAKFNTFRYFPVWGQQTPLFCEFTLLIDAAVVTNTTVDIGMFLPGAANPYAPTDGVYLRLTSTGWVIVCNNGGEITTALTDGNGVAFAPVVNQIYQFQLAITNREVSVWIDDVLYAVQAAQAGLPQLFLSQALPFSIRHAIGGTAASGVMRCRIGSYSIYTGDIDKSLPHGTRMTGMGNGMQVQQGATTGGQLTTYAVGAAPAVVTLTASTSPATNTLGGLALLPAAITVSENDYPLFAWQNPTGTAAIPGKRFFCTSIIVGDAVIYPTALIGGPLIIQWAVGWGSTAASLATTETTTFTSGTTKIARKHPLGTQVFAAAAAVGVTAAGFQRDFTDAPLCINPGEYLHIIIRCQGVNTTGGTPRVQVAPIGYFE